MWSHKVQRALDIKHVSLDYKLKSQTGYEILHIVVKDRNHENEIKNAIIEDM